MSVAEALRRVLERAEPLATEMASLVEAHGRVLGNDIKALRTQPPAAMSAMDGYAARAADVASVPATLKLVGEVAAGHPFEGTVGSGEAARIFTGGVLPAGADTIVIQENTRREGGNVVVLSTAATGRHVRREGCEVTDLGIAPDRLPETVAAVRRARDLGSDILVTSGGASVGDHDLVQRALAAEGLDLSFWKVAVRPGKPMMHGRLGSMHVLGLPGNPVSSYVCSVLFLVPLIRRLAGRSDCEPVTETACLGCDLPQNDERQDYLRATLAQGPDGALIATPFPAQDSSMLLPLAKADCLVIRAPHAPAAPAGSPCVVHKFGI